MGLSKEQLLARLKDLQIGFSHYEHPVVLTVEAQAKYVRNLGGGLSKNLFLKDKKCRFYIVSTLADTKVDLKVLSIRLGLGKGGLRMAPEETLGEILQVPLSCVTPFSLVNESACHVSLLLDQKFRSQERCFFHPLSNDMSISLSTHDLDKFLKSIGRDPSYVDLEANPSVGKDQPPDLASLVPSGSKVLPDPPEAAAASKGRIKDGYYCYPTTPTTMSAPFLHFMALLLLLFLAARGHPEEDTSNPIITRFQDYLRINTAHPNPDYTPAVAYLNSIAESLDLQTQTLHFSPSKSKPLLLLTWPGSHPSLPSILLNSHLDSIPAEPDKWSHPPFSAHRNSEGHIFARGAQDDKCIAIQYLESIRNLKAANFTPIRSVHVSYVPDEEIGGSDGAAKFAASKEFQDLNVGFVLDEGQANPGDELRVFYADRTPWNLIVKAKGIPGHGSRMYDNSAMENLMKSVELMTRFREAQFDEVKAGKVVNSEVISVNPVYLKSGIASPDGFVMNIQPSEAEAGFNIRIPPTVDPELVRKRIAEEWAPESRNLTYQLIENGPTRDYLGRPLATPTDDSNPWWSVFKQAIASAGGKLAKPEILATTTDARFMRQQGIPALGFSPMTNTPILLHEHNEFLKDTIYLKGIKIYESVISALSSFEETSQ